MFTNDTYLFPLLQDFNNYVGNLSSNAAKIINAAFQWKMNSKPGSNRFEQCEEVVNLKTTSIGYPSILLRNNIAHHVPYHKYLAIVPFDSWLKLGENLKILSARIESLQCNTSIEVWLEVPLKVLWIPLSQILLTSVNK